MEDLLILVSNELGEPSVTVMKKILDQLSVFLATMLLCDVASPCCLTDKTRLVFWPWLQAIARKAVPVVTPQQLHFFTHGFRGSTGLLVACSSVFPEVEFYLRREGRMFCFSNEVQAGASVLVVFEQNGPHWGVLKSSDEELRSLFRNECARGITPLSPRNFGAKLVSTQLVPQLGLEGPRTVLSFYQGTWVDGPINIRSALWNPEIDPGDWLSFARMALPAPFSEFPEVHIFRALHGSAYDACLCRVLHALGIQWYSSYEALPELGVVVLVPDDQRETVAVLAVKSMVFVLDFPRFVKHVSGLLHTAYFSDHNLELLVGQIQVQEGGKRNRYQIQNVQLSQKAAKLPTSLRAVVPELAVYRLTEVRARQHLCKSKSLKFLLTCKVMLLALTQFVLPEVQYVADLLVTHLQPKAVRLDELRHHEEKDKIVQEEEDERGKRREKRGKHFVPVEAQRRRKKKKLSSNLDEFLEDALAAMRSRYSTWLIALTVPMESHFRRVALVIRKDLQLIFYFDPLRDRAVRAYVRTVLAASSPDFIRGYRFVTVVRQDMLVQLQEQSKGRHCSQWIALFVVSATVLDENRLLSRFNAEVAELRPKAEQMDQRLFLYSSEVLDCFREVMVAGITANYLRH